MTRFAEVYAVWLADYYLLATVLLTLASISAALLKQPAQRLMVTKSALAALVLLAILCALPGWSVVHLLTAERPPTPAETPREERMEVADATARPSLLQSNSVRRLEQPATPAPPAVEVLAKPNKPKMTWPALMTTSHLAGMACIVIWLALGWIASIRLHRTAQPAPANVCAILDELESLSSPGSKGLRVFTHDRIDVAVALGVWRSMILLPARWTSSQSHDRLRTILAHEATHIRNHDLRWVALARTLFIPLWANPLFWLVKRRLRLDQEALADAAAAELTSRQRYAEQLVAWARDARSRPALHLSSAVGLWEGPSQLRQRIGILLDEQLTILRNCSRRWRLAATTLATAAAIGLSLITIQPGHTAPPDRSKPTNASAPSPPSTGTLTIRFEYDGTPPKFKELKAQPIRTKDSDKEWPDERAEKFFKKYKIVDESLIVGKNRGIANIFVWVRSTDIPYRKPAELPPATLAFRHGRYEPHAMAFQAPCQLVLRNDEDEACNFNLSVRLALNPLLPPQGKGSFDVKPQMLPVRASGNLQQWLTAFVFPVANPYFALSDSEGKIRINDLPPGKWEFQVWHEQPGLLKTADWPKGRFALEIKPGENDLGTIKLSPKNFNLTKSQPTPADRGHENKPISVPIVVAKHVMFDGKKIITWDGLDAKIAALSDPSLAYPEFYVTKGAREVGLLEPVQARFTPLRKKFNINQQSEHSLAPRADLRYDRIKTESDLIPDKALRVEGAVQTIGGAPAAGAEVVLCLPVDDSLPNKTFDIYLREFRLRNRFDEIVTDADAAGRFAVYPPDGTPYYLIALHRDGFGLVRSDSFEKSRRIEIQPWARIAGRDTTDPLFKSGATVSVHVLATGNWPELSFHQYTSDMDQPTPDGRFDFAYVPPSLEGELTRDISHQYDVIKLRPGEALKVADPKNEAPEKAPATDSKPDQTIAPAPKSAGTLTIRFEYDGAPPAPKEIKEGGWRNKLDNSVMRTFNVEKRVGAKVFDESLVVGDDRGIANVLVWVRSRDIPVPPPQELPPVTITYKQGRLSPHVLAFQAPRRLVMRNEGLEACGFQYVGGGFSLLVQKGEEESSVVKPVGFPEPIATIIEHWRSGSGYVLPLAHPFAAVSDNNGVARIENLPAGKWEFQVWHELRGWLKTADWPMGRFTVEIKPGDNDLGTVKLSPAKFNDTAGNSEKPATDTNREQGSTTKSGHTRANSISRPEPNTITGRAVDENGRPIAAAEALLFRINRIDYSRKLQAKTTTDAEGKYRFENVIDIPKEFPDRKLSPLNPLEEEFVQVYVRAPGRVAGMQLELRQQIAGAGDFFDMTLQLAYKLGGRVTGPDGKPVAGALVSVGDAGFARWEEVASARTKTDGTYMINDAAPYSMEEYQKKKVELRTKKHPTTGNSFQYSVMVQPPLLTVEHPDFALKRTTYEKIPGMQDVKLEPAAVIEGRVVMEGSQKPASEAIVHLSNLHAIERLTYMEQVISQREADARTDAEGKYRFAMLPAGGYELSAEMPGRVNVGINAFAATGLTSTAPNLVLTSGGIISIRLIDDKTGKPIPLTPDMRADIAAHQFPLPKGLSRPAWNPSAAANAAGRFELHALPGKRAVFVFDVQVGEQPKWAGKISPGESKPVVVDLVEGKTVEVDIPVVEVDEAKTTGTLQLAPIENVEQQPKSKPSSDRDAKKNDGAKSSTPKAEKSAEARPSAKKASTSAAGDSYTAPITISGRTYGKNAQPIADATVYLASQNPGYQRIAETKSDKDGKYTFKDVQLPIRRGEKPEGDGASFEIFGTADGYALSWRQQKWYRPNSPHYDNEHYEGFAEHKGDWPKGYGSADPIEIDLQFGPAAKVRGRIVDDHGKPIANTLLDIRNADSQWDQENYNIFKGEGALNSFNERNTVPRNIKTRKTDADGRFEFSGLPINNRFWIWVHPPGFPTREIWAVTNDTVDTASKGDAVYKGDINLVFATPRKVPIVAVYGDTGKPAPKVMVSTGGSQGGSGGSTDDAGQVVATLPDGEYSVSIEPRIGTPYLNSKDKIVVTEASVKKPAQVVLRPAAVADISVVDSDTGKPLAGVDLWRQEPNADSTKGYRGEYGYYAWEVETRISHYDKHRTDADGKMQVLFEPGKHRIGVGLNAQPDGYKPVDADGKIVELEVGKPQVIQFQMRRQTESSSRPPVKFQLVQNTAPVPEKTVAKRPPGILGYGDDKPDGKKSLGGSGEMIKFELPKGVTKVKGIRIHGSRYGLPQAPKEDFEITFLNEKRDETLHAEAAPYHLFNRGKEQWVRVAFKNQVELPRKFWVCLNFNAAQTKGIYVSYDTSTKGEYSRVGLPGDKDEPKETDFKGDWMVQLLLAKPEK